MEDKAPITVEDEFILDIMFPTLERGAYDGIVDLGLMRGTLLGSTSM